MNVKRRVDEDRAIRRNRPSLNWSRRAGALLGLAFLASVLLVSGGLVESASAAIPVVDVPCEVCGGASDPLQFTFMARAEASESAGGAVDSAPLGIGDVSDPVQYTFAARRSARLAQEAEITRLRGLAGPGAGSWAGADESVHLRGLAEAARSGSTGVECVVPSAVTRSQRASAARLTGMAERYLGEQLERVREPYLDRADLAEAGRLTALASHLGVGASDVSLELACLMGS